MGIEEWTDMMPDTVTIEPFVSRDAFGDKTYGTARVYTARVQGKNEVVRTRDNVDAVSTVQVYVDWTPTISPDDRITLPSRFSPTQPPILSVQPVSDEAGPHHQVVLC